MKQIIKDMVRADINFNHNGHAPYSVVKQVVQISKIVYERVDWQPVKIGGS